MKDFEEIFSSEEIDFTKFEKKNDADDDDYS